MADPAFRSDCPVASALDLFGDKWTLVVVRDLFIGRTRFGDMLAGGEGIATNILADRLARLERHGLVSRHAYQAHPPRHEYRLTERGADLLPVLQAIATWGVEHIPDRWRPPAAFLAARPADFYPARDGEGAPPHPRRRA